MKKKRSPNQRAFKITKKNQIVIAPKTEEPVPEELLAHSRNMTDSVGLNSAADIEPDNGDGTSQTMRLEAISQIDKAEKPVKTPLDQSIASSLAEG